ncbi:A24 family peptidase [Salinibacterium sp. ZJ70]|uniref:prepilin peptidase n=1 Tax=Salinibacterium sp. ZJ70 TaxID=2708084 RepID=UPI0014238293|nr:A24 family peptidase [Salinibacterium sp. ZJ70]
MSAASALAVSFVGLLGAAVGSFLNVVVWRVPRGLSVVAPPSACPGCGAHIAPRDNIPLASWLVLRGRCRSCRGSISARYPAVEALTLTVFVAIAWWRVPIILDSAGIAVLAETLVLAALLIFAALSIALSVIDLELHRLPNPLVATLAVSALLLFGGAALATGDLAHLGRMLIAGAGAFTVFFVVAFIRPDGMGFGDVKLAGALGLVLGYAGWGSVVVGFFTAFLLGALVGVVMLIARRATRGVGIPFGPWLLVGAWFGFVAGDFIAQQYLAFVGLV